MLTCPKQHAKRLRFTEAEAKAAIEAMGSLNVLGLTQDNTGIWRATTVKDDKPVEINLDIEKRPLRVVFTVRSEFEPQFAQSSLEKHWTAARFLVPRMTQDELRRVIEGPASVKVIRFEPAALVEQLVNEVVEMPGALPVLSFALSQMYKNYIERRGDDRALTFQDYEALKGGVTGSLRVRANEIVDAVDEQHGDTARRVLERFVSVETGAFARRRVPKRELDATDPAENSRIDEIVDRLVREHLIISDEVGNEPFMELAHDALILGWDRLLAWVREDAGRITALRRLTPDAEEWGKSRTNDLLWDDPVRAALVKQLISFKSPGLNKAEERFAKASLRRSTRNRIAWWSVAALLVILTAGALTAAIFANAQATQAEMQREQAKMEGNRALASASLMFATQSVRETESGNATLGALVALEGLPEREDKPLVRPFVLETEEALRTSYFKLKERVFIPSTAKHISISPDSQHFLTLDDSSGKVIVRRVDNGEVESRFGSHTTADPVFSPDSATVITFDSFSNVRTPQIWDRQSGSQIAEIKDSEEINAAEQGSDRTRLVSLIDRFVVQLSQVFMLRVFPVGTIC